MRFQMTFWASVSYPLSRWERARAASLDPATLKIDRRANLRRRQVLAIEPGSGDGVSAVRLRRGDAVRHSLRLRQGFVEDTSLDGGWDGVIQHMQERWQQVNSATGERVRAALLKSRPIGDTDVMQFMLTQTAVRPTTHGNV